MHKLTITAPDDWHCHLRDNDYLATTVKMVSQQFKRAIVMPNLNPPVTTVALAGAYFERIKQMIPPQSGFTPLMTLYLTDETTPAIIQEAKKSQFIFAVKLYPMGVTTHSEAGVTNLEHIYPIIETMANHQLPLLIHGEVNDPEIDIFDREKVFIDRHLRPLIERFPTLKVVLEHITTEDAVQFVSQAPANLAATITPHHLLFNRNALLVGGIKPHHYCLPILKRKTHQAALIEAATSGNPKFFIGTDSAPHAKLKKESACGCAGIFNHIGAIEMYAHVFEQANKLDKLEGFTSHFGADFYGLPRNQEKFTLVKQSLPIPEIIPFGKDQLIPFLAGETLSWQHMQREPQHG